MAAAFAGAGGPSRASDEYVRQVFDQFASTFDEQLQALAYQGPQLIAELLVQQYAAPEQALDVLDAGCGTGLCGPVLRPYAHRLVGVDLSGAMLDKARGRGVFDELVEAELTAFLSAQSEKYDLIVAADTFHYFGNLEPLFEATCRALRTAGAGLYAGTGRIRHVGLRFPAQSDWALQPLGDLREKLSGRFRSATPVDVRCHAAPGSRTAGRRTIGAQLPRRSQRVRSQGLSQTPKCDRGKGLCVFTASVVGRR